MLMGGACAKALIAGNNGEARPLPDTITNGEVVQIWD